MPGPVALIGAGAFLPAMNELDRELLAATGRPRPRVVIVAAGDPAWSGADEQAADASTGVSRAASPGEQALDAGIAHFTALGAEVEPLLIAADDRDGDDAALQAIGEADVVYLADGRTGRLCEIVASIRLGETLLDAHRRGAVIVGCTNGAGVLASRVASLPAWVIPWPVRWEPGLGLLPNAVVLTAYDRMPEPLAALIALQAPRGSAVLGIDANAALVGRDGAWQVHGAARVTVWRGRHRRRFRVGDVFRI